MTMQLRMELRRSTAPLAALAAALLYALLLWRYQQKWSPGWPDLSTDLRFDLSILVPLALGAGAWQGGRERRGRTEELLATTSRPIWQRVLVPGAAVAGGTVAGVLLPLVVAAGRHGPGLWLGQAWPFLVVLTGLLALVAAVALGVGLGHAIRSNLVAPLLMFVLALVLVYTSVLDGGWGLRFSPVLPEPAYGDITNAMRVRPAVTLGQVLWFGGVLAGGLILAGATRWRGRALAGAAVLAGFAVAVPLLASDGGAAYDTDPVAVQTVCAPGLPPVCGTKVHEAGVLKAAAPARQVLAALQRLPDPPTRAIETESWDDTTFAYPARPLGPDTIGIWALTPDADSPADIAQSLADGLGVPSDQCDRLLANGSTKEKDAVTSGMWTARELAGAWLLNRTVSADDNPDLARDLRKFKALPDAEQVRRMTAVRKAFVNCTAGSMALLAAPVKAS